MMNAVANVPNRFKLYATVLALAVLVITLLAVTFASGSAQAQDNTPTPTPTPTANTYADPQPCGPGAGTAFQPEPHEVHEGHFALFDTYWQPGSNSPNTGKLRTNLCPPLVSVTENDEGGTVITLTDSEIDIDEAIFHVLDDDKVTVVSGTAGDGQISTDDFARLAQLDHVEVGDQVWWLRLDGASDLVLGFSTKRFSSTYWASDQTSIPAFRYMFELERTPGLSPEDHPHFLAYKKPRTSNAAAELVWDSNAPHLGDLEMQPGQLEDLQWIFTKPGTYEIWVHMLGYVRQAGNPPPGAGADWEPINGNKTETSEVKRYVIQVGSELNEVEPPSFGVSFTIDERPAAEANVGTPIQVFGAEGRSLSYTLSGKGHGDFDVVSLSNPDRAQLVVANGVTLNPGARKSYLLTLGVTDGVDHESNRDTSLDHTIAVNIELTYPSLVLTVDNPTPRVDETVTITAHVGNFGEGEQLTFHWSDDAGSNYDGETSSQVEVVHTGSPTTLNVSAYVTYVPDGGNSRRLNAVSPVTISWR